MRIGLLSLFLLAALTAPAAYAAQPQGVPAESAGTLVQLDAGRYVITPFESVSISDEYTWTDNRHRAYVDPAGWHANGFLLFDVSGIPDGEIVTGMALRCYLEDAFGSPAHDPYVDIYYSADDNWTRDTALPGSLSLDVLLLNDVHFTTYTVYYDFTLDAGAHDWSGDLGDNRICIGFTNDVPYNSYVYFHGAYGEPAGPPPELTIETTPNPSPVETHSWGRVKALYR